MTINCKGKLIDLSSPRVMGIINITPDSFFEGSRLQFEDDIISRVGLMLEHGADFIDVGGYSSRPGAADVSETEELDRVLPVVNAIIKNFPDCILSVDTFRSGVAKASFDAGAAMVNDISGGLLDREMIPTVGELGVPYIIMHMKGQPQNMQEKTEYEDLLSDLLKYFSERMALARQHQIKDIIIDPGFGFAKTIEQNFELLKKLDLLKITEMPVLVGLSRKSMIYKTLKTDPEHALNGSTALHAIALSKGANILRVHDVKEAVEVVTLFNSMNS
ncbi:MAG: dihydropteroate synthase [Flavobacteriaceae bacterium]|nr:dihydropteroate synthase [Bacteroidia bacterium]NNK87795.1 dihydropteroate synthase [Flavobacteriaceae bacterium]